MKFAEPIWLLAGLIACLALAWRYRRFDARQRVELAKFASASLIAQLTTSVSAARRHWKRALVIAGVASLTVALARPLVGFRWEEARRRGLDLLLAVDTSKSMLAQDVKPDRLARAKMAVEDLLAKLDGDRVGLIAFAGNAFLQCPLTLDYDAFRQSLDALDTKIIPRGGTDLAAAIHEAEAALEGQGNHERILVLLTDGEDLQGNALDAARAAAEHGLKIFTLGIGRANGELIPLVDETGGTQFAKDASGQFVKSRLDESMLKQIAEATGAMYQPLGQQAQGLETIYQQGLAQFTRRELASRMQKVYRERFQWPLSLGLLCLVLDPLIGIRRRGTGRVPITSTRPALAESWNRLARPASATAAVIALFALAGAAQASTRTAEKAYQKGEFPKAEQEYRQAATKNPDKAVLQFNHGAAAYKAGSFEAAADSFSRALKTDDLQLQQDDYYNLGNTQYRVGQKTEKANTQDTIKAWEDAIKSYEAALQLKTDDADAKYNHDLVKRKLEELKQQPQNKQQPNQPQNQEQKNQDQKDQNKQDEKKDRRDGGSGQQATQDQKPDREMDTQDKGGSGSGQENKPAQKPEPQDQNAQAGRQPDQKKDGQPQARNSQPKDNCQEQADARAEPGKMSRQEAKQLLDSLKSGDRKMPLAPYARGNETGPRDDEPLKDW